MDEEQFAAMFADLYPVVLGYAARRTDWHVAEDIAAQTLTIAWHRGDVLPADRDGRCAWLIVVARNLLANSQRARMRAAHLDVRIRAGLAAGVPMVELDPASIVVDRIAASTAMRRLAPRDQEILQLVAWDGLDLTGLSRVLGCSTTAAAMRLHRARRRLELLMRAGHPEADDGGIDASSVGDAASSSPRGPDTDGRGLPAVPPRR
ncbi:sigma-70 family RNA polymerase sigma factor [Cellulomonas sp. WB94]|uniref:RNA polymerase sigma factor n=1 Tax=Cellulomonas sp. WB94 TaxID=2173174 RepID=UPI0013049ADE|nr:sigma-70 family RNA polymerase sigma factor [Cellulomonas sp. WB94]